MERSLDGTNKVVSTASRICPTVYVGSLKTGLDDGGLISVNDSWNGLGYHEDEWRRMSVERYEKIGRRLGMKNVPPTFRVDSSTSSSRCQRNRVRS